MQINTPMVLRLPFPIVTPDGRQYRLEQQLGSGSFGAVYLATDAAGTQFAIKLMGRGKGNCRTHPVYVQDELLNHHAVSRHPHVISFKETFVTDDYLCLVMEYAPGGTLHDFVKNHPAGRLPEPDARSFFQQLLLGVDYCHRKAIQIRDIKLENALLATTTSDPRRHIIKLCDFGYSKSEIARSQPNTRVGTLIYMAPEVIREPEYNGFAADVWSLGIMLYIMLTGHYPYPGIPNNGAMTPNVEQLRDILRRMLHYMDHRLLQLPANLAVGPSCADLLYRMLDPNPETRIPLRDVMRHSWVAIGLPPNYYTFNNLPRLWQPPTGQTEGDIRRVANEARTHPVEEMLLMQQDQAVDNLIDEFVPYANPSPGGTLPQWGPGGPHLNGDAQYGAGSGLLPPRPSGATVRQRAAGAPRSSMRLPHPQLQQPWLPRLRLPATEGQQAPGAQQSLSLGPSLEMMLLDAGWPTSEGAVEAPGDAPVGGVPMMSGFAGGMPSWLEPWAMRAAEMDAMLQGPVAS